GLCRRGGHQVGDDRPHHSGYGLLLRGPAHRASLHDAAVPAAHRLHLQPVRLHHRLVGGQLREAANHPAAHRHAAYLPGRQFLLDRHVAGHLADSKPAQPSGLPGERLPLEFLRNLGCERGRQHADDAGLPARLLRRVGLDFPDRLPPQALSGSRFLPGMPEWQSTSSIIRTERESSWHCASTIPPRISAPIPRTAASTSISGSAMTGPFCFHIPMTSCQCAPQNWAAWRAWRSSSRSAVASALASAWTRWKTTRPGWATSRKPSAM